MLVLSRVEGGARPKIRARLESHSFSAVPEKAERIPPDAEFDREFSAWAQERNIDIEDFERVV